MHVYKDINTRVNLSDNSI